ncbi:hypothetical protein BDZ91DRAFT_406478 [Kalaharituber pfeilii]|nr:hypothetical protein BDZ91DRAFT_406478 [Kalaharituber pfeilii]
MTGQAKGDYSIGSPRMVLVGRFSYNTQRRTGCCHLRVSYPSAQPPQVGLVYFLIILQSSWPAIALPARGNLQAHGQWFNVSLTYSIQEFAVAISVYSLQAYGENPKYPISSGSRKLQTSHRPA